MFKSSVRTARIGIIASTAIAATLSVTAPGVQAATAAPQKIILAKASILRCDMTDGAVIFADKPCEGAAQVKEWAPVAVPRGITRTPVADKPAAHPADALTLRNPDPYVDCKNRGGRFHITARLCVIPSKGSTKIQRLR
jgi:hypothetical protein